MEVFARHWTTAISVAALVHTGIAVAIIWRAQVRRQEGTAVLFFVMDRDGRVLEYRIQRSSGHQILDREVQAMIERAQPLPGIPDNMRQARPELAVPVQFFLR